VRAPTTAAVASSPKLLDRVRWHLRVKHYSIRTEQAYVDWIRRYILFHRKRHPNEMGEKEITEFLTHLAVEKNVAASTQNQAFSALLFLYQKVLERKLDFIDNVQRARHAASETAGRVHAGANARRACGIDRRLPPDGRIALRCRASINGMCSASH
jgi:hypothetical protein